MIRTFSTALRMIGALAAVTGVLFAAGLTQSSDASAANNCFNVSSTIGGDIMQYCFQGRYWVNANLYYDHYRSYSFGTQLSANMLRYVAYYNGRWNLLACFADGLGTYRQLSWCDF